MHRLLVVPESRAIIYFAIEEPPFAAVDFIIIRLFGEVGKMISQVLFRLLEIVWV